MAKFDLHSEYSPTGDQPQAIDYLTNGVRQGMEHQTLLGVTGSGKTFTVANVIANVQKPTLVISHNKTLAAQLYQEYKEFFPNNAVEYFVSYYDYYQPEAYIPSTDTYIEKDADINEDIDKMRLSTTNSLLTRKDVIVVASVSAIYNLGSPVEYLKANIRLKEGMPIRQHDVLLRLLPLYYVRSDYEFKRGTFRVSGEHIDVFPAYLDFAVRISIVNDILQSITFIDPLTGRAISQDSFAKKRKGSFYKEYTQDEMDRITQMKAYGEFTLYPAKHYVTPQETRKDAIAQIKTDLFIQLKKLKEEGKQIEAYRLQQKTEYDIEMMNEVGYCKGIENYSRYFDGREPGSPPYSLLEFFPKDYLTVIDESHITVSQIRGMYNGDKARKQTLIDYGFRLPSALDNRPLQLEEFLERTPQIVYTSATPTEWEITHTLRSFKHAREIADTKGSLFDYPTKGIVELLIRPTGLIDPQIFVRGTKGQIENLLFEIRLRSKNKERVLVTTLTKRMAEDLAEYLREQDINVHYLHSDIDTLERTEILNDLRRGVYEVVVGINLLREGLDLPEVSLVAILDADKEGFLRSESALIQTMGRAARHLNGTVIMYADTITGSMQRAIDEVDRRRAIQKEYNEKHGIDPTSINKPIRDKLIERDTSAKARDFSKQKVDIDVSSDVDSSAAITQLTKQMKEAAKNMEFERAAMLRDRIDEINRTL
ncbi:excinuclease ABC subunit B [candidate division WWE3 bacterium CG_4_10_14_0_2_um_filter_41_14]|uniref:UvrABC system protein B n=1 Tax=candidate division WWE3 bacterium CG_4_10_14_0_2_um_filter_41_14 TaxID=1975072 RepID=A0A2M7TIA5_UNCKA|nr:MAG: excinuclease ABC subunit B [candidate division WWE3 bacterium CG_4_10_14_0_2_um_filter_41_14]